MSVRVGGSWADAMRCLACGAEMHLVDAVQDDTMPVAGYEHRTFECSACGDIEQRLVFTRHAGSSHTKPVSVQAPPISPAPISHNNHITTSGTLRRVFAKWHSACHKVGRRLLLSDAGAQRFRE